MKMIESIQFYEYKEKFVIIEFTIEPKSHKRFKTNPFNTDKYIQIHQWEEIYSRTNRVINEALKKEWQSMRQGKLNVDEYDVEYKLEEISQSRLNFDKFHYELDWFIKITIRRHSSKEGSSLELNNTDSSDQDSQKNAKENEIIIPIDDDDDNISDVENNRKRIKLNNFKPLINNANSSNHSPKIPTRSSKRKEADLHQGNLNRWITAGPHSNNSGLSTAHTKKTETEKDTKRSQEKSKATVNKKTVDGFDKHQINHMKNFVEKSELAEMAKENRKKDLENIEILKCNEVSKKEIKTIIKSMKDEILNIFSSNQTDNKLIINNQKINPFSITSSNVVSEMQIMDILNEVENLRDEGEKGTNEEILHEVVLPLLIIEIFKRTHYMTQQEALDRIHTQEEKKTLYNNFDDSII